VLLCTGDEVEPEHLPIEKMRELLLGSSRVDDRRHVAPEDDRDVDLPTSPATPDIMSMSSSSLARDFAASSVDPHRNGFSMSERASPS